MPLPEKIRKMSESQVAENPLPPPTLGQHSAEILHEILGLDADAIETLRQNGAINAAD